MLESSPAKSPYVKSNGAEPARSVIRRPTLVAWTTSYGPTATELWAACVQGTEPHGRLSTLAPAKPTELTPGAAVNVATVGGVMMAVAGVLAAERAVEG